MRSLSALFVVTLLLGCETTSEPRPQSPAPAIRQTTQSAPAAKKVPSMPSINRTPIATLGQWELVKLDTDRGTYIAATSSDGPRSVEDTTEVQVIILGPACKPSTIQMFSYGEDARYAGSGVTKGTLVGRVDTFQPVAGQASVLNFNNVAMVSWESLEQVQSMIESMRRGKKARFQFTPERSPPEYFVFDSANFADAYSRLELACKADMARQGRDPDLGDYFK
jgi:hypothetical protein